MAFIDASVPRSLASLPTRLISHALRCIPWSTLHAARPAMANSDALRTELAALGAPTQPVREEASPPARAERLLIADDEADMRLYLRGCLTPRWRVMEAADGRQALRAVRVRRPALVIADVHMPRLDGLALCEALASDPTTAGVPVLLISGKPPPDHDCTAFLAKPFTRARLLRTVERLLAEPADGDGTTRPD